MKKVRVNSLRELETFTENFLKNLKATKDTATIVSLCGDLGSGKTTFTQHVGKVLGIRDTINSPTFVVSKTYSVPKNKYINHKNLIHIDAYRLGEKDDVKNIGLQDQINNPNNLIFIEWAEIIKKSLPKDMVEICFEYISEDVREITTD